MDFFALTTQAKLHHHDVILHAASKTGLGYCMKLFGGEGVSLGLKGQELKEIYFFLLLLGESNMMTLCVLFCFRRRS